MTNENDHAETVHCFWICVQDFANLTFYAETECTVPSKATLLWEFVRRFYQWTRYAVLSKSAALSLKYVQNVYTCPEKRCRSVPDMIHIWYGCTAKPNMTNRKASWHWPDPWRHKRCRGQQHWASLDKFPGLSNTVRILWIDSVVVEIWGSSK